MITLLKKWVYYFCPRQRIELSPKWQKFYSGPFLINAILGPVKLHIQKTSRSGAMVVHVNKIERYYEVTPDSWLPDGICPDALGVLSSGDLNRLFQNNSPIKTADIVNNELLTSPFKTPRA